jgi:hypothetical protein
MFLAKIKKWLRAILNQNKLIYIYWGQGFENAPPLVNFCLSSWKKNNPDWQLIELNNENIGQYIDLNALPKNAFDLKNVDLTAFSDVLRISLLKKTGGLWVDATTFCTKPLNEWFPKYRTQGFFAFSNPGPDRLISSWFLFANKNNYLIEQMYQEVMNYWSVNKINTEYFWLHYLFNKLYRSNEKFKSKWDNCQKISADLPHFIQAKGMFNNLTGEVKEHIDEKKIGVYKLSHKIDHENIPPSSSLKYLIDPQVKFIHIGKCGGTYIQKTFNLMEFHLQKPSFEIHTKYIIWIRNPLTRFISAFNHSMNIINFDFDGADIDKLSLDNCQAPYRIKFYHENNYAFSKEYDELILFFKTPNYLAESITSKDKVVRKKAISLMRANPEHIYKGIGWYLDNGEFIKNHHKNILMVGTQEKMLTDSLNLSHLINYSQNFSNKKIRENKNMNKYLSEMAIKNLIEFYKETDYKALNIMFEYGLISKATLMNYYTYKN